jgi:formylglycine-generating enzyme required for sulfatase activity
MKRVFCLIMVFVSLFALASCSDKKKNKPEQNDEKPLFEEEVAKEIPAEEGGTITNSDESVTIEIPAGALDSDTKITMRVYDAKDYPGTEDKTVISKVVEFEPTGTVFKKPVVISMISTGTGGELRAAKKKVITAAVYREKEGKWSYSKIGYAVKISKNAAGDPIMTTAAGDPIMLNAAGDPIMITSDGEQKMLSAAGDPIMISAAGDPIMMSAAGDPIMMTTGHFTAYAFFFIDVEEEEEPVEEPDDNEIPDEEDDTDTSDTEISDTEISDEDEIIVTDEDETPVVDEDEIPDEITDEDEDIIIPEPEKVYSKVLCTGMAICTDGEGNQILCPKENEDFYGQDAQYAARKGCVPHSYTEIENPEEHEVELRATVQDPPFIKDDVTGLTWWLTGKGGTYEEMKDECAVSYGGIEDWRLPEPQEIASLSDLGMLYGNKIDPVYFQELYSDTSLPQSKSYGYDLILTSVENYFYLMSYGVIAELVMDVRSSSASGYLMCVSGEKYGEVSAETYSTVTENGAEMIRDLSTDLFWQKEPVRKATWKEALAYCENLEYAGHTDWRLPNMNELLSLVDYSKIAAEAEAEEEEETEEEDEVEAISSFPGMTPDVFWTSTPAPVDYYVWVLNMQGGAVFPYGEASGEPVVGPQQPRSVKSIKRDEIAEEEDVPAVLCVRSDLEERTEVPECDGTGTGPCTDAFGTIWSSRIYPEIFVDFDNYYLSSGSYYDPDCELRGSECDRSTVKTVYIYDIAEMCRYLSENGSNKWRLPTIDEIRNTVTTEKLKKDGGTCGVTTVCREESCFDEEACTGDSYSRTILNDFGAMFSGTVTLDSWSDGNDNWSKPWIVDAAEGLIYAESGIPLSLLVQRCVLDNTLDDYETIPYTDPAGLTWSDLKPYADWRDAYDYCAELNTEEDTENFWRLPTMEELQTLVRHCEEGNCAVDFSGKYSVLGDISYFWSSDLPEYRKISCFDFSNVEVFEQDNDYYARFRCVSGGDSACAGNPCASVENSTGRCFTIASTIFRSESDSEYSCECDEDYSWNGTECLQVAVVN